MIQRIDERFAKSRFEELLDKVARQDRVIIVRRGVPVAMLVPPDEARESRVGRAIEGIRELRDRVHGSGTPASEFRDAGRKR